LIEPRYPVCNIEKVCIKSRFLQTQWERLAGRHHVHLDSAGNGTGVEDGRLQRSDNPEDNKHDGPSKEHTPVSDL
jgi:hypothetical protein